MSASDVSATTWPLTVTVTRPAVGVIVMDVGNPYYTELARGIEHGITHLIAVASAATHTRRLGNLMLLSG